MTKMQHKHSQALIGIDLKHVGRWVATCLLSPAPMPRAARPLDMALELPVPVEPRANGCGWFDSSRELREGLSICEHTTVEAMAQELPLGVWLDWHLGHWQAPAAA